MSARRLAALLLPLLVLAGAGRGSAQTTAGRLISAAREQLEAPNPDSAAVLLERALDPAQGSTIQEQARAWVLYGIAQLMRDNRTSTRQAFRQALQRDPSLRIDSLYFFHDEIEREFGAERAAIAPVAAPAREALAVALDLPGDTNVPAQGGRIWIETRPTYAARVEAIISSVEDRATAVWSEIAPMGGAHTGLWDLRDRSGALVRPGRYSLRATATDSAGVVSSTIERILVITRVPVDTQALPPPPTFEPETLRLRGSPVAMLVGLGLGAAAVALPTALGNPDLNSGLKADQTSYAVAGAVSVAGIVGFLKGRRVRPLPQNIQRNRVALERYEFNRAQIAQLNARARENAPVRVQVEGPAR